jgi:hypothetical protein
MTNKSDPHKAKYSSHKISTDAGIIISINPVSWNALFSIRDRIDWIGNIVVSLTNKEALIMLLRAYNQQGEVSAVLRTKGKADLFRPLLAQLDQE